MTKWRNETDWHGWKEVVSRDWISPLLAMPRSLTRGLAKVLRGLWSMKENPKICWRSPDQSWLKLMSLLLGLPPCSTVWPRLRGSGGSWVLQIKDREELFKQEREIFQVSNKYGHWSYSDKGSETLEDLGYRKKLAIARQIFMWAIKMGIDHCIAVKKFPALWKTFHLAQWRCSQEEPEKETW